MSLTICRDCGKTLSTDAKMCPNCGASKKNYSTLEERRLIVEHWEDFDPSQRKRLKERLLELREEENKLAELKKKGNKKDKIWLICGAALFAFSILYVTVEHCSASMDNQIDKHDEFLKIKQNKETKIEETKVKKEYSIEFSEFENNRTRIKYTIVVDEAFKEDKLNSILQDINKNNKIDVKNFVADFYTPEMDTSGTPYATGSLINNKYDLQILIDKSAIVPKDGKKYIGKWNMYGSSIFVIYEESGRYYSDFAEDGVLCGDATELLKTSYNGHVAYTHKIKDEFSETYEIVPSGVYTIDAYGNKGNLFPNAE